MGRAHTSKAERGRMCQEEGLAWAEVWRWRSVGHVRVQRATQRSWKIGTGSVRLNEGLGRECAECGG